MPNFVILLIFHSHLEKLHNPRSKVPVFPVKKAKSTVFPAKTLVRTLQIIARFVPKGACVLGAKIGGGPGRTAANGMVG